MTARKTILALFIILTTQCLFHLIHAQETEKLPYLPFDEIVKLMEKTFLDLDYTWGIEKQNTQEYIKAHNDFIEAYRRIPRTFRLSRETIIKLKGEIDDEELTNKLELHRDLNRPFVGADQFVRAIKESIKQDIGRNDKKLLLEFAEIPPFRTEPINMPEGCSKRFVKFDGSNGPDCNWKETEFLDNLIPEEVKQYTEASQKAAQQILADYYYQTVYPEVQDIEKALERVCKRDQESALAGIREKIREMKTCLDSIHNDPSHMKRDYIALSQIILDETKFLIRFERKMSENLESDVSFGEGEYALVEAGKKEIEKFVKKILDIRGRYHERYPGRIAVVIIKTIGYTDAQGFVENSKIEKELLRKIKRDIPNSKDEKRKLLNKELSRLRAATVNYYAKKYLVSQLTEDQSLMVTTEGFVDARGEELPPMKNGDSREYVTKDHRRRICKISAIIQGKLPETLERITFCGPDKPIETEASRNQ